MKNTGAGALVFVLLSGLQGLFAVEFRPSADPACTGDNVTLELSPPNRTQTGVCLFNGVAIVLWIKSSQEIVTNYSGRVTFNSSIGTLSLQSVTVAESGVYEVQSFSPLFRATASLTVLDPVSNVTVTANAMNLVEFNDTVSLQCNSQGTSVTFRWLNGTSDIRVGERVQLSDDNRTLTISNVLTSDKGPFYCLVSNAISNMTSEPIRFNISYGPDNVHLFINESKTDIFTLGSNITLLCSADSSPPAEFQWYLNGASLHHVGQELRLKDAQPSQSGNYTCWAHNTITRRYSSETSPIFIENSAPKWAALSSSLLLSSLLAVALPRLPC